VANRFERELADLQRLSEVKRINRRSGEPLGPEMVTFFKQAERRQNKFGKIGGMLVAADPRRLQRPLRPRELSIAARLPSWSTAPRHLYELKQLLLAGLQQQLLLACKSAGLRENQSQTRPLVRATRRRRTQARLFVAVTTSTSRRPSIGFRRTSVLSSGLRICPLER
jgi:hypothetical protein